MPAEGGAPAPTVFLANRLDHADAVSAGPVSHAAGMPVLLTAPDRLPETTAAAIGRLGAREVLVLGGERASSRPSRVLPPDPWSLAGRVLRVAPDGLIPGDNPVPGSPVLTLGHRNVQGLAFDTVGRLHASELGQDPLDE